MRVRCNSKTKGASTKASSTASTSGTSRSRPKYSAATTMAPALSACRPVGPAPPLDTPGSTVSSSLAGGMGWMSPVDGWGRLPA